MPGGQGFFTTEVAEVTEALGRVASHTAGLRLLAVKASPPRALSTRAFLVGGGYVGECGPRIGEGSSYGWNRRSGAGRDEEERDRTMVAENPGHGARGRDGAS